MLKNNSFNILSLSCLRNIHLRDGSIIAFRVMTGLFVEPDLTYPGETTRMLVNVNQILAYARRSSK